VTVVDSGFESIHALRIEADFPFHIRCFSGLGSMSEQRAVSPNNPCPFLRALVANGYVDGHIVPRSKLSETIALASGKKGLAETWAKLETYGVTLVANGSKTTLAGLVLDELRNGPLDKHGAGSRILGVDARVHEDEIERLATFGQECNNPAGGTERGLTAKQIDTYMAANMKRAGDAARFYYPKLMEKEWPVLLDFLGKGDGEDRYLSVAEVRTLIVDHRLPDRIIARLPAP
jgi:hypothetical protein